MKLTSSAINGLQADSVFDDYSRKCGRVLRRVEQKHRPRRRLDKNKNLIKKLFMLDTEQEAEHSYQEYNLDIL